MAQNPDIGEKEKREFLKHVLLRGKVSVPDIFKSTFPEYSLSSLPLSYHIIPILLRITFINRLKEGKA